MMDSQPVLGVIGGSGLYSMDTLASIEHIDVDTPFGEPSSPILIGELIDQPVAFLARHGIGHQISPSEVNYRANIYALKSLGVKRVLSVSACGSLREDYSPGEIVVPDQLFDFTRNRKRSFFEDGMVAHISVADPFCSSLSAKIVESTRESKGDVHDGGTFITIEGPRFSTRAESNTYRAWGMSIIGMTTSPEAFLAREAEMCYSVMAHVTDFDVWHIAEDAVSVEMVIRILKANTDLAQRSIAHLVSNIDHNSQCPCHDALKDALITDPSIIPNKTRERLGILVDRYLS
jgi:5'-methylthioadenosine phosphorylase